MDQITMYYNMQGVPRSDPQKIITKLQVHSALQSFIASSSTQLQMNANVAPLCLLDVLTANCLLTDLHMSLKDDDMYSLFPLPGRVQRNQLLLYLTVSTLINIPEEYLNNKKNEKELSPFPAACK